MYNRNYGVFDYASTVYPPYETSEGGRSAQAEFPTINYLYVMAEKILRKSFFLSSLLVVCRRQTNNGRGSCKQF